MQNYWTEQFAAGPEILSAVLSHNKTVNNTIHSLLFEFLFLYYEKDACVKNEHCARKSMTLSREVIEDGLLDKSFWLIYNMSRTS